MSNPKSVLLQSTDDDPNELLPETSKKERDRYLLDYPVIDQILNAIPPLRHMLADFFILAEKGTVDEREGQTYFFKIQLGEDLGLMINFAAYRPNEEEGKQGEA